MAEKCYNICEPSHCVFFTILLFWIAINDICKAPWCYTGLFYSSEEDPLLLATCLKTMNQWQKDFALVVVSVGWPAPDNISSCCVQTLLELKALVSCNLHGQDFVLQGVVVYFWKELRSGHMALNSPILFITSKPSPFPKMGFQDAALCLTSR